MTIALVVPFLNEEGYLGELLESLAAQTRPPDRLVLVDDGSTDRSAEIAQAFADGRDHVTLLRRPPRRPERDRMMGAPELRSFQWAVEQLDEPYDVIAKLDADLRLPPQMLAELERRFAADPRLGLAGAYLSEVGPDGRLRRHRCPPGNVEGATKFYRRECLEAISPVPAIIGWDTIDEARIRSLGWRTQTFAMPGGDPVHLRRLWAGDGVLRGYRRAGRAAYGYGAHPLTVLLSAAVRMRDRPRPLAGVSYLAGWALAALGRRPRAEPELRRFIRREQLRRIRALLRGREQDETSEDGPGPRICMVVHSRYPHDPRVARATRMAHEAGFRVEVVCLREHGRPMREVVDGVAVQRLPLSHRRGVGPLWLALEYAAFTLLATVAVALRGGREGYDVVHVHNPPDFLVLAALLPRMRGARVLLDIHDLSPLMFDARFRFGGSTLLRFITAVERAACAFADGVVTVHEPYREELASHGVDPQKITIVMNTPDERLIQAARERAAARGPRSDGSWKAVYHGTITEWYGVPLLVRATALVAEAIPRLHVEVIGEGDDLPQARAVAEDLGLAERVSFTGRYLPIDEVLDRVASADCGTVPNLTSALNSLTLSSKLLEYVALEVPVVVARLRTLAHHFGEEEVTFFAPDDAQSFADALRWVAEHPDEARAKAARALRRASAYRWQENRDRYVALLRSLTGRGHAQERRGRSQT